MFFLWNFLYATILLLNAVAILSEDRFLARGTFLLVRPIEGDARKVMDRDGRVAGSASLGGEERTTPWGRSVFHDEYTLTGTVGLASGNNDAFGQGADQSVKTKIISLIASVRLVMKVPLIVLNIAFILYELLLG
ncbi:protein transport protein YOS1 [Podospora aff. communis PSN243]|uniref:Protein transport protein YOS1 n=1 Tax=Podospora aff. communis PSN243 TaxID=3040156 RepID=A0AAV9GKZ9_9PEZI|nr:protein transport protein YOS1 [Podospora aff. communis PSN243]